MRVVHVHKKYKTRVGNRKLVNWDNVRHKLKNWTCLSLHTAQTNTHAPSSTQFNPAFDWVAAFVIIPIVRYHCTNIDRYIRWLILTTFKKVWFCIVYFSKTKKDLVVLSRQWSVYLCFFLNHTAFFNEVIWKKAAVWKVHCSATVTANTAPILA